MESLRPKTWFCIEWLYQDSRQDKCSFISNPMTVKHLDLQEKDKCKYMLNKTAKLFVYGDVWQMKSLSIYVLQWH